MYIIFRRSPISVAAAAIFMASQASIDKKTHKGLFGVSISSALLALEYFNLQLNDN